MKSEDIAALLESDEPNDLGGRHNYFAEHKGVMSVVLNEMNIGSLSVKDQELKIERIDFKRPLVICEVNAPGQQRKKSPFTKINILNCENVRLVILGRSWLEGIKIINSSLAKLDVGSSSIGKSGITIHKANVGIQAGEILIRNVETFEGPLLLEKGSMLQHLKICNSTFDLDRDFNCPAGQEHNLIISSAQIQDLEIESSDFHNGIFMTSSNLNRVNISGSGQVLSRLDVIYCSQIEEMQIAGLNLDAMYLGLCKNIGDLIISDIRAGGGTARDLNCESLDLPGIARSRTSKDRGRCSSFEFHEVNIQELDIQGIRNDRNFQLSQCKIYSGNMRNCEVADLIFKDGLLPGSYLSFDRINCHSLRFEGFTNAGTLYLKQITDNGMRGDRNILAIIDSDLGNVSFINCYLDKNGWYHQVSNSNLLGINIVASRFPEKNVYRVWNHSHHRSFSRRLWHILKNGPEHTDYFLACPDPKRFSKAVLKWIWENKYEDEQVLLQERLLFSQLQKVYERSGSRVRSILFKKKGQESYLEYLSARLHKRQLERRKRWLFKRNWIRNAEPESEQRGSENRHDRWDWIALTLHQFSSDFDYKLNRAVAKLLCVSIVLYTAYVLILFRANVSFQRFEKSVVVNIVAHYFDFLSPIHSHDFFTPIAADYKPTVPPTAELLDGLSKIIIGYLIYQTVQAFRKFGRSSS